MDIASIIKYVDQNHGDLAPFVNIIIFIINCFILWLNTQQKFKLGKEIEGYKHLLQKEFLKAEIKTTQLFSIYPEMFSKFKKAESAIYELKGPVNRQREVTANDKKNAENIFISANNYLVYNLLFLSSKTAELAENLTDIMSKCLYCENADESIKYCSQMREAINLLMIQMQKELEANAKNIS